MLYQCLTVSDHDNLYVVLEVLAEEDLFLSKEIDVSLSDFCLGGEYLRNSQSNLHIALLEYMAFQPSPLVHSASGETMFEVWVISLCTLFLVDSLRVHG